MRGKYIKIIFLILFVNSALGQNLPPIPSFVPSITLDYKDYTVTGDFPYDQAFTLVIINPPEATHAKFYLKESKYDTVAYCEIVENAALFHGAFYLPFDDRKFDTTHLQAGKDYTLKITFLNTTVFPDGATSTDLVDSIEYSFTVRSNFGNYVKTDFGFGYVPKVRGIMGFTSAHFYLLPINDDADLARIGNGYRRALLKTSFFIGISPLMLQSDTQQPIIQTFGVGNFIYGLGFRSPLYGPHGLLHGQWLGRVFLQPMRITLGQMLFRQADENSMITKVHNKHALYVGLSLDLNISSAFGAISKLTTP